MNNGKNIAMQLAALAKNHKNLCIAKYEPFQKAFIPPFQGLTLLALPIQGATPLATDLAPLGLKTRIKGKE